MSAHLLDESGAAEELRTLHEGRAIPGAFGNVTDRLLKGTGIRMLDQHPVDAGSDDVRCPATR